MNYMDYNCQNCKILNNGHFNIFAAAYTRMGGRLMFYKHLLYLLFALLI